MKMKIFVIRIILSLFVFYVLAYGSMVLKNIWTKKLDIQKTLPNPFGFIHFSESSDAKTINYYRILQNKLNSLFYSYYTLKSLPVFPQKVLDEELIFDDKVFQLHRFKLKKEKHYYFYYPQEKESGRPFNKVLFFVLENHDFDKNVLHLTFEDKNELQLVFEILESYEYAFDAFKTFWEYTPEGNPNKVSLHLSKAELTVNDLDKVKVRWHKSESIYRYISKIESNIKKLQSEYDSPLKIKKFSGEKVSTIRKYKYKFQ